MNTFDENEFLIAFGKNLRLIRKSRGFTQENLANDMGVEISQISRIERGIISTSTFNTYKISKTLNIDVKDLFNFK